MIEFSPGLVQSCFELLDLIERRSLSFPEIRASFRHIGVMNIDIVLEVTQELNWIRADGEGRAVLTSSGTRIMLLTTIEARIRQAILDYVDIKEPFWLQNAAFGRKKLLAFTGSTIGQVFLEAGLINGVSNDIVEFWDILAARARGQKDNHLLEIGRNGERLSLAYERERTNKEPKWISIETNTDGYDVLSVIAEEDLRPLTIEVKSTRIGVGGEIYLTRNEWDQAIIKEAHLFHLWDISKIIPRLACVTPKQMEEHIPINHGFGEWGVTQIPLEPFNKYFIEQNISHFDLPFENIND